MARIFHREKRAEPPLMVHRDVNGKLLALLMVFCLAVAAVQLAGMVPPRVAERGGGVVNALDARGGKVSSAVHSAGEVRVKGLDYLVPRNRPATSTAGVVTLAGLRDSGLLRGYSVPRGRLAFGLDGTAVFLPSSPSVGDSRAPETVFSGSSGHSRIALTFDSSDVEEPAAREIIDELTRIRAPATLFVCGRWCEQNPELLRLAVDRGFEVANHSYSHPAFTRLTDEQVISELERTAEAYRNVTGKTISAYFRPPYEATDARVEQVAANCGYEVVLWDRDTVDWSGVPSDVIRDRASFGAEGGDIVIMHLGGPHTAEALAETVANLRADGFELTTVSGVLQP